MSTETPDLAGLVSQTVAFVLGRIATVQPGKIVTYDPSTQTATVQPSLQGYRHDPSTDSLIPFTRPPISGAPVVCWRAGSGSLTGPLEPGDPVMLVTAERSLDEWKTQPPPPAGAPDPGFLPTDPRRFDRTDTIVIPGLAALLEALPPDAYAPGAVVLRGDDVRLGSSLASDPVALAGKVLVELNKIVAAFNAHTHNSTAPGTPSGPPVVAGSPLTPVAGPDVLGATKIKGI